MVEKFIILFFYLKAKYFCKYKSRVSIEKMQKKKIHKFLKKICKISPFYARLYENLSDFESENNIIDKKIMLKNFDSLNTAGLKLEEVTEVAQKAEDSRDFSPKLHNYSVGLSSGTSGNRGVFVTSDFERAMWCGTILAKILPWSIFRKTKIAFFLRANNNLYETVNSNSLLFKFFDLKKDYNDNLKELNDFKPDLLIAPPAMLNIIADAQNEKIISIQPAKIISVADVLYDDTKSKIEKTFKQIVHQVYQATEGFLGCTCKYGNLHLNEDILYVKKKYIGEHRFIPIITDFNRITQPVINYELNDILIEDLTPCPCGSHFTRISKIEGRCDDILKFNDTVIFPDFIVRKILQADTSIEKFRLVQVDDKSVDLYLLPDISETSKTAVLKALEDLFVQHNLKINICVKNFSENQDLTKKRKRVQGKNDKS